MTADQVRQAQRGDQVAFEALIRAAYDGLVAIAYRILRDRTAAEDATQDAVVRCWRDLRGLREPDRFEAWLHRLLVNACRDVLRGTTSAGPAKFSAPTSIRPPVATSTGRLADQDELERAFLQLPADQRIALVLTHYVGYSAPELAVILNVPTGTRLLAPPLRRSGDARSARRLTTLAHRSLGANAMTQNDDAQLAAWLAEGPSHGQPGSLERALSAASATRQRPAWLVAVTGGTIGTERTNRSVGLAWALVAVVALIGLLIAGLVVGGWLRPQPAPDELLLPSATAIPSASAASPSPSPGVPLGGGLILVFQPHEPRDPCDDRLPGGPFDIFSLDAGTGAQTLLGTTAEDCSTNWLALQWASDREHILMTDDFGQDTLDLDTPTAAGRDLTFICCDLPTDIWKGGASAFDGWLLSPAGDRVAAIGSGLEGPARIVVANIDGSGLADLSVPAGAQIRGWATWAPDQSALVVAACLPCNEALEEGQPATAENHDHLYVVPVDGSPVRELLDDTGGWFWTPSWSPDGSTFATVQEGVRVAGGGTELQQPRDHVVTGRGGRRGRIVTCARHERSARGRPYRDRTAALVPRWWAHRIRRPSIRTGTNHTPTWSTPMGRISSTSDPEA